MDPTSPGDRSSAQKSGIPNGLDIQTPDILTQHSQLFYQLINLNK